MKLIKSHKALRKDKIYYCGISKRYVFYNSINSISSFGPNPRYYHFKHIFRRLNEPYQSYVATIYPSRDIYEIDKDLENYFQLFRNDIE